MKLKNLIFTTILLLCGYHQITLAAYISSSGNIDTFSSDLNNNFTYEVYPYTFNTNTTLNVFTSQTPHFSQTAYNNTADEVRLATGISFSPTPVFNSNYRNTVIIAEMDTNENTYAAVAIAFNNQLQNCSNYNTLAIDPDGITITGINLGLQMGAVNGNCTDDAVDTGLIVFNTEEWNLIFNPSGTRGGGSWDASTNLWTPPLAVQEHWILHEFTHLLGLGHNLQDNCNSVMMRNIVAPLLGCTNAAPNTYWNHDDDLLRQIGY